MEIFHVYPKRRGDFGRQCLFSDRQAELLVDILPDPSLGLRFREQSPRERALQAGWSLSEHHVSLTFFNLTVILYQRWFLPCFLLPSVSTQLLYIL